MALHRFAGRPFRRDGDTLPRHTFRSHKREVEDRATEAERIAATSKVQHMIVIVCGDARDELRQALVNMLVVVIIMTHHHVQMPLIEDHLHLMLITDRRQ